MRERSFALRGTAGRDAFSRPANPSCRALNTRVKMFLVTGNVMSRSHSGRWPGRVDEPKRA
jgi:hypothetical protein